VLAKRSQVHGPKSAGRARRAVLAASLDAPMFTAQEVRARRQSRCSPLTLPLPATVRAVLMRGVDVVQITGGGVAE
jgi:hypothetical protein